VFIIIGICVISGGIGGVVYGVKYFGSDVGGGPFKDGFVGILNGSKSSYSSSSLQGFD
jgi:hypothetical protein